MTTCVASPSRRMPWCYELAARVAAGEEMALKGALRFLISGSREQGTCQ